MSKDKRNYFKEKYVKNRKESKETYKKRKKYLESTKLRTENIAGLGWSSLIKLMGKRAKGTKDDNGSAESSPGEIGNVVEYNGLAMPAEKGFRFTSGYGMRNGTMHMGVDIAPKVPGDRNTKILSVADGVVLDARGGVGGFGCWIVIKHSDNLCSIYGHMPLRSIRVKKGDRVKKGQHIALMGQEGMSYGIHLHLELCRDFSNRRATTFDPQTVIDFSKGSSDGSGKIKKSSIQIMDSEELEEDEIIVIDEHGREERLHTEYSLSNPTLTKDQIEISEAYSTRYEYRPVLKADGSLSYNNFASRRHFLINRIGWGRSTKYMGYQKLDPKRFIHHCEFDGFEGNLYSPDAAEVFNLLMKEVGAKKFEIISGFRFSEEGLLSPHEAGCAIDILVKNFDEARKIADCAWMMGIKSVAIGGDFNNGEGFIHVDIAPKGNRYGYGYLPIYEGPGQWSPD